MSIYDYLVVGAGPFGSVFAHEAHKRGKKVLVIDRRNHIGGNMYCENKDDINIHVYGAHIFHTSMKHVWDYVNQFAEFNNDLGVKIQFATFNNYINSPVANYKGEMYNLPFNMNTFSKMWGISTPDEAKAVIEKQRAVITDAPKNLEEQAISLVGTDIYEKLIKGYTEKQWGRPCTEIPSFIIKRLPVRYTYDNNYFNDRYQGIPEGGYTKLIENILEGIEVRLGVDFIKNREELSELADKIIYTGPIDEYYNYEFGQLEYRGLRFETEKIETDNYQGVAVVNYTAADVPYTRVIEHKHFEFGTQPVSYVTKEYPADWKVGDEAYYPVNNEKNQDLYAKYALKAKEEANVIFGGRLAEYVYYDMDKVIASALRLVERELV